MRHAYKLVLREVDIKPIIRNTLSDIAGMDDLDNGYDGKELYEEIKRQLEPQGWVFQAQWWEEGKDD